MCAWKAKEKVKFKIVCRNQHFDVSPELIYM